MSWGGSVCLGPSHHNQNVLAYGRPVETCPTIGLSVKEIKKGGVSMKCWDVGGQQQYRAEWGRYTRGCDVIIFVVDTNAVSEGVRETAWAKG